MFSSGNHSSYSCIVFASTCVVATIAKVVHRIAVILEALNCTESMTIELHKPSRLPGTSELDTSQSR